MKNFTVPNFTQKSIERSIDDLIIEKFPSPQDLINNIEFIIDVLRDDVERFSLRTGKNASRFYDAFSASTRMTIGSLNKDNLSGTCRFMKLPGAVALRWFKSRLLNNVVTSMNNKNSKEYLGRLDREEWETVTFGDTESEAEIGSLDSNQISHGLREMWLDGADIGELKYLANKLNINLESVIGKFYNLILIEKNENKHNQMAFDFEGEL
jgi:hypothetical protein